VYEFGEEGNYCHIESGFKLILPKRYWQCSEKLVCQNQIPLFVLMVNVLVNIKYKNIKSTWLKLI
jgi:hypothetical protein